MAKILTGKIVSVKMKDTVVVAVENRVPHPLYKKLQKRTRRFLVDSQGMNPQVGQTVKIIETKPKSRKKYFELVTTKEEKV